MVKSQRKLLILCNVFVIVELLLGITIHLPIANKYTTYLIIVLACLFCIVFAKKTKSYIFTQIALICTVGADLFLVIFGATNQLAGMIFFVGTQTAYFLRIYFEEERLKIRKFHLIARICASTLILLATCLVLGDNVDALALVSMLYFVNLFLNIVFAFINFKASPIMAIGLLFFILCDIFIGLLNIGPYFTIQEGTVLYSILYSGIDFAWIFYVPSQILLAISLLPTKIKKRV